MRGWFCRLQLLLGLASAVNLRSESHGTHDHILLSQIRDSSNLEGHFPVFISTRNSLSLNLMLRPTVSRPVCLGISTHLGLTTRFLLLSHSCEFVDVGRSLWREGGSVFYNRCWSWPAQSFSSPSPMGLITIFCCLRFENSLFVASYDPQGYDGNIGPPPPQPQANSSCFIIFSPPCIAHLIQGLSLSYPL
jgi:hypothetical protein